MIKIILCALNEAHNLKILIPNIANELEKSRLQYEIIVCLDGSSDESYNIILDFQKKYQIKSLELKNQRGLGLAYKRIFLEIIKNAAPEDIAISLDADNTHNPWQLVDSINYYQNNKLDLLILSRFCQNSVTEGFPLHRKFISKVTSLVLRTIFPIKKISGRRVRDYSSGYRLYSAAKLKELYAEEKEDFILEKDFTYTCEILLNLALIKARIDEVALVYNYNQKIGNSKLGIIKNSRNLLKLIFRHILKIASSTTGH